MSEHKHTPGPWKCHPVSDKIANSFRWYSISGPETSQSVRDVLEKEVQANAELIARAPELLTENEALKAENERLKAELKNCRELLAATVWAAKEVIQTVVDSGGVHPDIKKELEEFLKR